MAEQIFGLFWRERVCCDSCNFTSKVYNRFDEMQKNTPGRRPANIGQGIHVGLSQISIGASSFTKVLCSMNTPPPSVSGMQNSANINMKVIMEKNVKDMKLRRQELLSLNILSGKHPASVNVQAYSCYNNALSRAVKLNSLRFSIHLFPHDALK